MKYFWMIIRLLLPVAAIVLLALSMLGKGDSDLLLCGGLLCSSIGIWLNLYFQRKERKSKQ